MNDVVVSTCTADDEHLEASSPTEPPIRQNGAIGPALKLALALPDRGKVAFDERELRRLRHSRLWLHRLLRISADAPRPAARRRPGPPSPASRSAHRRTV